MTHAFSHFDTNHILMNMFGLYFFGRAVEYYHGKHQLADIYLLGALTGGLSGYYMNIYK